MMECENRKCDCMNDYTTQMNNNMNFSMLNSTNDTSTCGNDGFDQNREEMLERIKCLNFAITELNLYLDTHPEDEKALCLHRKYCKEYRELTDKYQKVYGPLTVQFPCNKWRWLEGPWPWEGEMI